jgi:dTMP kinase
VVNKQHSFLGFGLSYLDVSDIQGKLIVIEGTDGVGRTTHIESVREWLEVLGYGVVTTGWNRSMLMKQAIDQAKAGHRLNVYTFSHLYLADFADRLEHEIIPALKAGFIVLADRYVYTALVRTIIRGADRDWINEAFGFALEPNAVFYLRIGVKDLIPRVINSQTLAARYWEHGSGEGLDYWESGMDLRLGGDLYDSFVEYQRRITVEFDRLVVENGFRIIDATRAFAEVDKELKEGILGVLRPDEKTD